MKEKVLLYLVVATLAASVIPANAAENNDTPRLGMTAPPLKGLEWIKGEPVEMKKGSIYVVEFWATWCPPCRTSIPHLTKVQAEFKDQGVTIIGISDETAAKVKPFVAEKGDEMDYTVAISPDRQAQNAYMKAFGVGGIPHAFIIDKTGALVWHDHPMKNMDEVLKEVVAGTFNSEAYAKKQAAEEEKMAQIQKLYSSYFKAVTEDGDAAGAKETGAQLLQFDHEGMLNSLAWTIIMKVPEANKDLELARKAGAKAVELTEGKNAAILDTYARATYELARKYIEEAIAAQKEAVELSGQDEDMKKTLERYESASAD